MMKIENLSEGLIIKNYKELCSILEIKVEAGNSKKAQLKELERFVKCHKEGNKFVIDEVYSDIKEKVDMRFNNGKKGEFYGEYKKYDSFNIPEKSYKGKGVYIIKNDKNDVYIGSTYRGFRTRFQQHYRGGAEHMKHTYDLLHNRGEFSILHDMSNVEDIELIRIVESEAIKLYLLDTRYNVINKLGSAMNFKKYKKKLKNIKISEDKYYEAVQLLVKNGLLDEEGVEL